MNTIFSARRQMLFLKVVAQSVFGSGRLVEILLIMSCSYLSVTATRYYLIVIPNGHSFISIIAWSINSYVMQSY
jgi:Na+-transporting NADH:ubiquinone oxidoreductase subunit NqrD